MRTYTVRLLLTLLLVLITPGVVAAGTTNIRRGLVKIQTWLKNSLLFATRLPGYTACNATWTCVSDGTAATWPVPHFHPTSVSCVTNKLLN